MITAWALPADSGGLEFSETEIAFLFPAPLRRRDILLYKILRAQPQALFSALIMTMLGWWRNGLLRRHVGGDLRPLASTSRSSRSDGRGCG